jgi:hypothetical protein
MARMNTDRRGVLDAGREGFLAFSIQYHVALLAFAEKEILAEEQGGFRDGSRWI